jgi:NADH-quinone oxidoreductase subunit J
MVDFLFYVFSAMLLVAAVMVVAGRKPVTAAMFLLVAMASAAAMFFLLEAFFLGVLQILVYAGAVVVLFLFIIMLLDPESSGRKNVGTGTLVACLIAVVVLFGGVLYLFTAEDVFASGTLATTEAVGNQSKEYGYYLFSFYLLPFMVAGFLLLIAMVGVILISKRNESLEGGRRA